VRASRNTALITLAADLPVKVLSDLLGINIATSVLSARQAARDWNGYVAALPETPPRHLLERWESTEGVSHRPSGANCDPAVAPLPFGAARGISTIFPHVEGPCAGWRWRCSLRTR
jgi:hypothetical protein